MIRALALILLMAAPASAEAIRHDTGGNISARLVHIDALRSALVAHPETPDPVGDPASLVVIGFEAGCRVLR